MGAEGADMNVARTWGLRANTFPPSIVIRGSPSPFSLLVRIPGTCQVLWGEAII